MASKLFHTVVGFGIALGATGASTGCAAEAEDGVSAESAQIAAEPAPDRFCEVAWPTTKGGPRPIEAMSCIDPKRACGRYPGGLGTYPQCFVEKADGTCDFERESRFWMVCDDTLATPAFVCPTGTKSAAACRE